MALRLARRSPADLSEPKRGTRFGQVLAPNGRPAPFDLGPDAALVAQHDPALHDGLEFPDVARPRIIAEQVGHRLRHDWPGTLKLTSESVENPPGEGVDLLPTLPEGWDID